MFVVLQDRLCSRRMIIYLRFSGSEFIPKTERCDRSVDFKEMTTWLLLLSKAFSNPVPCRATIPFHSLRERVEATLYGGCRSIWKLENAINFFLLLTFFKRKLPILVLYFLLDVNQIGGANISFQILRQGFCGLFQVPLIVLQNEIF